MVFAFHLPPRARRLLWVSLLCVFAGIVFTAGVNAYIIYRNTDRLYTDVSAVPVREIGLVLGTSRYLANGQPNLHFANRIAAAAALYHAGKVRHLLVSGDHHRANYNEPGMMTAALVAAGVPASAITRDDAGFRTLDSVVRAQEIFGVTSCTIITQRFHNTRALEIARAHHFDAIGFCAADPAYPEALGPQVREVLARVAAVIDLYVLHRQPHFLGQPEPITLART
ncbi:MAG: YdcF family protein [Verrucomicrobia bacterium]|nr:YdcF family protein [Verrucomicrobiota bacterium]